MDGCKSSLWFLRIGGFQTEILQIGEIKGRKQWFAAFTQRRPPQFLRRRGHPSQRELNVDLYAHNLRSGTQQSMQIDIKKNSFFNRRINLSGCKKLCDGHNTKNFPL